MACPRFSDKAALYPDPQARVNPGDSVVVAPGGAIVAGPLRNEQGILNVDIDTQRTGITKHAPGITPDPIFSKCVGTLSPKARSSLINQDAELGVLAGTAI